MTKKFDIEDIKKRTEQKQKADEAKAKKAEEKKQKEIEAASDEVVENILEKLQERVDKAIEDGRNYLRIYSDEFRWSYDRSKYSFQPVDIMRLEKQVYHKLPSALRKEGFSAGKDSGYPHSNEVYEEWIEVSW